MSEVQSGYVLIGSAVRPIKRFHKAVGSSGDNTLIAAVEGKKFLVLAFSVIATSATPVSCYLHNGDNAVLGTADAKLTIDAAGVDGPAGAMFNENRFGWFETDAVNEALEINLSGATAVICVGAYVEID